MSELGKGNRRQASAGHGPGAARPCVISSNTLRNIRTAAALPSTVSAGAIACAASASARSDLPGRLEALPAGQVATIAGAAEHFVPAGEGTARESARESIVDGFVLISEVGVAISVVAAGAALFVRHRSPLREGAARETDASPASAAVVPGGEPAG